VTALVSRILEATLEATARLQAEGRPICLDSIAESEGRAAQCSVDAALDRAARDAGMVTADIDIMGWSLVREALEIALARSREQPGCAVRSVEEAGRRVNWTGGA